MSAENPYLQKLDGHLGNIKAPAEAERDPHRSEILAAPAAPTGLVAAELPIKRQTVKRRLDDLAESGRVAALATGQGHIWWLPEGEGGYVDPWALARTPAEIDPRTSRRSFPGRSPRSDSRSFDHRSRYGNGSGPGGRAGPTT